MIFVVRLALAKALKTAEISWCYHWFPCEMKWNEEWVKKFHTDEMSLLRPGKGFWLVEAHIPCGFTNQKHYPDLGSDTSLV